MALSTGSWSVLQLAIQMLIPVFDLYFNLMSRERNNVWLFYNPWFPLQKSIRLIFCYSSYLVLLIFCLFCFIKKKQKRSNNIFSQNCSCYHSCHTIQDQIAPALQSLSKQECSQDLAILLLNFSMRICLFIT